MSDRRRLPHEPDGKEWSEAQRARGRSRSGDKGAIREARAEGGPTEGADMAKAGGNQAMVRMLTAKGESAEPGRPLESATRARMESAFGVDLSHVRLHTGPEADQVAGQEGARAFAIGRHVGFKTGEYRPGTPVGDAVLAHELAHVLQQREAATESAAVSHAPTMDVERDADRSAAGVLARLWTVGSRALEAVTPRVRSGLALNRCTETEERQAQAAFQGVVGGLSTGRMQPIPIPMPDPEAARGILQLYYHILREDFILWQADGSHSPKFEAWFHSTNYPDWAYYSRFGDTFGEIWPHFLQDAWRNQIRRESSRRGARGRGAR
ncbi:MAG: DUF4157 domain-containing protein [Gemmatimonadota bacterium]